LNIYIANGILSQGEVTNFKGYLYTTNLGQNHVKS